MKKYIVILFMAFSSLVSSQKEKAMGSWLASELEYDGKTESLYWVTEYAKDGKMIIMGMEFGTWEYDKENNAIVMKSDFDKDFNGSAKIINLTEKELIYEKDGAKITFQKLDLEKIANGNKDSGLVGMWEFKGVPNLDANSYLMLKEPDEFTIIEKQEGMESQSKGTWVFNKHEMSLVLIGFQGENVFKNKNKIVHVDNETIVLKSGGKMLNGVKKPQSKNGIEHLTFTQDDFYTDDGDYKYNGEESKLPWQDPMHLMMSMLEIKSLVYNYATLLDGTESFENETLTANVKANPQDMEFNVDNIFIGFDRYNIPEDYGFPPNTDFSNALYPLEGDTFRVIGSEEITTPAGTFSCTVVEAVVGFDECKKLWMVNDKLGVYAKIIEEKKDDLYGYYHMYELQKIITNQ